jgi:hypothetical protein
MPAQIIAVPADVATWAQLALDRARENAHNDYPNSLVNEYVSLAGRLRTVIEEIASGNVALVDGAPACLLPPSQLLEVA